MLTTEERSLTSIELKQAWLKNLRRPGRRLHPSCEAAGLITLRKAFAMVVIDQAGTPTDPPTSKP